MICYIICWSAEYTVRVKGEITYKSASLDLLVIKKWKLEFY